MACEVKWTASARRDVEGIIRHIATVFDSPRAASEHLDAFEAAAARIAEFPESCAIGKQAFLAARSLRPRFVKRYVMLYSYDSNVAIVHRVFHTLQDYARLIDRDK